jgi:type II secretory pathway component PulM
VGLALLYTLAVEPAWIVRGRVTRGMPELQEQLAQVEALRQEVLLLKQQGVGTQNVDSLRIAVQSSLERAALAAGVRIEGDRRLVVTGSSVAAVAWFAWIEQFSREARVRIAYARVSRAGSEGLVRAEVAFEVPRF